MRSLQTKGQAAIVASAKPAPARSYQVAISVKPALSFGAGLFIPHTLHSSDMQIAGHHLQADRDERDEQEWSQNNYQKDLHRVFYEVAGASPQQAAAGRAKRRQGYNPNACLN